MKKISITLLYLLSISVYGQVPKLGNDTLIEIANWNLEWFGSTVSGRGPSDDALQYTNVKSVLQSTDMDIWGLCEVSDETVLNQLVSELGTYDKVLADFGSNTIPQETAVLWKKNKFIRLSDQLILNDPENLVIFAGRPPLEVVLRSREKGGDTLFVYVVHFKANTGTNSERSASYQYRKQAAGLLKQFLDANRANKKVLVIGDWNDDLDVSIYNSNETPFKSWLDDANNYTFLSLPLTQSGKRSTVGFSSMIDHQLMSRELDSFYVPGSCTVLMEASTWISGYGSNTSDHYPVFSRFNFKRAQPVQPTGINDKLQLSSIRIFPNPASNQLFIDYPGQQIEVRFWDVQGELVLVSEESEIDCSGLQSGLYIVEVKTVSGVSYHKVQLSH